MTRVFINPGHAPNGIPDPGAVNPNTGAKESDIAYKVGVLVKHYLTSAALICELLQSDSLYEISAASNAFCADVFVSIHCNAFDTRARGTETLYCSPRGNRLAQCIQSQIVGSIPTADRGVKYRSDLHVLRATDATAVLVELAFIDNDDDLQLMNDRIDDFARAVARGVTDFQKG